MKQPRTKCAVVSAEGKVTKRVPLTDIMGNNGLYPLLAIHYPSNPDITHLNDVEAATIDGTHWQRGDWLLSLREPNMIMIYRPSTEQVVWLKVGPWINQHDPDYLPGNKLAVFGNDVLIPTGPGVTSADFHFIWDHSNIYIVDMETGATTKPFYTVMGKHGIRTPSQGRSCILPNGDAFVEETDAGHLVRFSAQGLV